MKIAVVMTTYNGERYLKDQLDSILNQTLQADELIVCDDCSTDGTIDILQGYADKGLLTYYRNETQLGVVGNFKYGLTKVAHGSYVAFSDQDDFWLPDKLEQSVIRLSDLEWKDLPCMVYTDLALTDENGQVLNPSFRNELGQDAYTHNLNSLLFGNFINGCTVLMNPVLCAYLKDMPVDVRLNHDGWIGLVAFTFGWAEELKSPLVNYRKHNTNVSIAADTKPRNRYRSTFDQLISALKGNDDFLSAQFETVERFYLQYAADMTADKKAAFSHFLSLKNKPYLHKKLAFRNMIRGNKDN